MLACSQTVFFPRLRERHIRHQSYCLQQWKNNIALLVLFVLFLHIGRLAAELSSCLLAYVAWRHVMQSETVPVDDIAEEADAAAEDFRLKRFECFRLLDIGFVDLKKPETSQLVPHCCSLLLVSATGIFFYRPYVAFDEPTAWGSRATSTSTCFGSTVALGVSTWGRFSCLVQFALFGLWIYCFPLLASSWSLLPLLHQAAATFEVFSGESGSCFAMERTHHLQNRRKSQWQQQPPLPPQSRSARRRSVEHLSYEIQTTQDHSAQTSFLKSWFWAVDPQTWRNTATSQMKRVLQSSVWGSAGSAGAPRRDPLPLPGGGLHRGLFASFRALLSQFF